MAKDPAALMYISNYLTTTAEMPGDALGWYTRLIMHHYDKGSLPVSIEKLATLANVSFSEFDRFKEVFKDYLEVLFVKNGEDRLINIETVNILEARASYKDEKSGGGKLGVFIKFLRKNYTKDEKLLSFIKDNVEMTELLDDNNMLIKEVFKEVFDKKVKLYIDTVKDTVIHQINPELNLKDENLVLGSVESYKTDFDNDYMLDQGVVSQCGFSPEQVVTARVEFWSDKEKDVEMIYKPYHDVQVHFLRWCRYHKDRIKKVTKGSESKLQNNLNDLTELKEKYA